MSKFDEGHFSKTNTRQVANKKCRTKNKKIIFDRIANSKMKVRNVTNSKSKHSKLKEGDNIVLNNRTNSHRAKNKEHKCHMKLALVLNPKNS